MATLINLYIEMMMQYNPSVLEETAVLNILPADKAHKVEEEEQAEWLQRLKAIIEAV